MNSPMLRRRRGAACITLAAAVALAGIAGCGDEHDPRFSTVATRGGSVAMPTIEGPITGGSGQPFVGSTSFDLGEVGYEQAEYFMSGTASAYVSAGTLGTDGMWTVMPGDTAAYRTRLVVYRPIDRNKFDGTVFLEWLNVSGGQDAAPDWTTAHTELIREGAAWVGVSAQAVGIEGGTSVLNLPVMGLKMIDPARYGSLHHPGDSFSYDIYSQAAQALRRPRGQDPLGGLRPERVLATGDSQSAFRLVTYIDAVHPLADIFDGFLVHSRGGGMTGAAALSEVPQPAIFVPGSATIRTDLDVPVMMFETETDISFLGFASARQPDSDRFRLWEVAGTAHADTYTLFVGSTDLGTSPAAAALVVTSMPIPGFNCSAPVNSGPHHFVFNAAVAALDRWVREGMPPPTAPRLDLRTSGRILREANGNASGGLRTPQVDVPIATLSGEGQVGSLLCALFGTTKPFDATTLAMLYPTHDVYVSLFDSVTDRGVTAGFILPPDAALMKQAAMAAVGG